MNEICLFVEARLSNEPLFASMPVGAFAGDYEPLVLVTLIAAIVALTTFRILRIIGAKTFMVLLAVSMLMALVFYIYYPLYRAQDESRRQLKLLNEYKKQ